MELDGVADWVRSGQDRPPPVAQRLDIEVPAVDAQWLDARDLGFAADVRRQPGGFDARFRPLRPDAVDRSASVEQLAQLLRAIAEGTDGREIVEDDRPRAEDALVARELATMVESLPVVGPGGRATLYRDGAGFAAEFAIRRRIRPVMGHTTWRDPGAVASRIRGVLGASTDCEIDIELGYFEASKYDVQWLMRPAYVVTMTQTPPTGWRAVLVEPATHIEGVGDDVGLEPWFSEEV